MAIRINQAHNFKGKAYVVADELDNLIKSFTLSGVNAGLAEGTHFGENQPNDWNINFTTADGGATSTIAVDLTEIKDYIDNKSITVKEGNGITIDDTGANALQPIISTNLKIAKVSTVEGYAASYQLQYLNHSYTSGAQGNDGKEYLPVDGDTINIVKDQFIKNATFGWSTIANDTTAANWSANGGVNTDHPYPTIKLEIWTNTDGNLSSSSTNENEGVTVIGIPLNDVFKDKTAGNGIDATQLASNVIAVQIETATDALEVYTAHGTAVDLISTTASGVKVADIQAAIDVAVNDEHTVAAAAISAVDDKVTALAGNTSNAVVALNTRIETVATNAQNAVRAAQSDVDALDSKVDSALDKLDSAVETAIDTVVSNVDTALDSTVATINANISAVTSDLNERIETVATSAATTANVLETEINALDSKVDGAFDALDSAVESAIDNVQNSVVAHTANAVQMLEVTSTIAVTSGTVTINQTANNIIAVYDPQGIQIYPEITRTGSVKPYAYSLKADYGTTGQVDSAWTILYTVDLAAYSAVNVTDVSYDVTASAAKTVGAGDAAAYTAASKTAVNTVNVDNTVYEAADTTKATVGNGASATAVAPAAAVAVAALTYNVNA